MEHIVPNGRIIYLTIQLRTHRDLNLINIFVE